MIDEGKLLAKAHLIQCHLLKKGTWTVEGGEVFSVEPSQEFDNTLNVVCRFEQVPANINLKLDSFYITYTYRGSMSDSRDEQSMTVVGLTVNLV